MNGRTRATFLLAGLGAIALITILLFVVGAGDVLDALATAKPSYVALTFGLALCWLAVWGVMLRTILGVLGVEIPLVTSLFVYAGAVFANNVTPFGQAGGEPVAALIISKVSDSRYETGLVGIASVDVLNVVPSISLIFVGVGYYATTAAIGQRLERAVTSAVVLIGGIVVVIALVWRYRRRIVERLPAVASTVAGRLGRSRVDAAEFEASLSERFDHFFESIERVATSPWQLAGVVGLSLTGWLFQAAALVVAFAALGHDIPAYVALFVIPLSYVAGAAPLPGGLGGIDAAMVALLVPTTGVPASTVTAAVLIFRGAVYWMPVAIGGASVSAFGVRSLS
ncbi:lysylphosphatidylglycerol synthase transmembrane domain-containing protein [Halovivax cerinus]|uniref:YbhN family protein n=1 Tax=Halovivax cerinus TaxID=1487865 RepID=A0ABD5NPA1_9EURY|nr:flippase-like domain-containing protein [Halovivax cerinus]